MLKKWESIIEHVDLAFQPIVDIHTGITVAVESLLRNYQEAGFCSIDTFFNTAYEESTLYGVDLLLRKKALAKIKPFYEKDNSIKLFYNLDNRILDMKDYENGHTKELLEEFRYEDDFIVYEISEKHQFRSCMDAQTVFNIYHDQGFQIALDDFGTGFSGLKMLYHLDPQYIKIDRFFITDIMKNHKKRVFVEHIVSLAHKNNILVLAEGIETQDELKVCQEIGCDLAQGFYIQKPTTDISLLRYRYEQVMNLAKFTTGPCEDIIESNHNLNEILGLVTHDLKSPLTAVLGSLDIIALDDLTKQEKKESVKIARKAARSVLKLVENILTMVKFEAGKESINVQEITNLNTYFDEIYDTFKYQTRIKNINFKMDLEDTLPTVFWDIEKIHYHVINNIISNAIKFTPNNGKITLSVFVENNFVYITIQDDGVGIDKKKQKNIFDKYTTHENQQVFKGKGLGLYNAYNFVRQHNGTINIIKGIGKKGVGFEIKLPIKTLVTN